ncbi:Ubiquinone biosynthesis O-methyltransferase, mitochondrial [Cyberlindnera fabianii]|uniref:Ubiquinone biosynthesis O-methyltransferase, mitochondrial n=1 Tax=Cyberlindnera fabianii TaxID=36022 RepID=A0A1V2LBE2_CYBFA|nr:Ubiquinone biosynthesis O-methyltransferase, mitochondrial [Cyberlindnera fabianii]
MIRSSIATVLKGSPAIVPRLLAKSWWDVAGPQRILHKMNLLRMDFIQETLRNHVTIPEESDVFVPGFSLDLLPKEISSQIVTEQEVFRDTHLRSQKLKAMDIGCGGGILTESLARLPFVESVKGIDLAPGVLEAANAHKALDPMIDSKITYKLQPVEQEQEQYDIVTMMEMLEHVDYPAEVLSAALQRVKPGGWLFLSTINRDLISYFTTILVAEHLIRIVPVGTHSYEKYINASELVEWVKQRPGYEVVGVKGCMYLPFKGWVFCGDGNTGNYVAAVKRSA